MLVTELGMVTEVRPLQPLKAEVAISLVPFFIAMAPSGFLPLYPSKILLRYSKPSFCVLYHPVPLKAYSPMLVTEFGMVTEVRPVQPENALLPMVVTLLGMVTEVRPVQPLKAEFPMLVTEFGMVTEVRHLKPLKASSPMLVTELGITVLTHPFINLLLRVSIIALQLSRES